MPMLNIGSSKQLFFDDYLIESLVNAKRGLNPAVKVDDNPVLRPERPWEGNFMRPAKVIFDGRLSQLLQRNTGAYMYILQYVAFCCRIPCGALP